MRGLDIEQSREKQHRPGRGVVERRPEFPALSLQPPFFLRGKGFVVSSFTVSIQLRLGGFHQIGIGNRQLVGLSICNGHKSSSESERREL